MKTIIAVSNGVNRGKTKTLRELALQLMSKYPNFNSIEPDLIKIESIHDHDFRIVIEIKGKIIGIDTQGDPNTKLEERLEGLASIYQCDIIFCATRTRGKTIQSVHNIADKYNYDKIWTSTYDTANENNYKLLNKLKGKQLIELTEGLNLM